MYTIDDGAQATLWVLMPDVLKTLQAYNGLANLGL
jgi:hypothetical protein